MSDPGTNTPKTVSVRIALVVNDHGFWSAAGWKNGTDSDFFDNAGDGMHPAYSHESYYIVTVEVPIPTLSEVAGTVIPAERNPLVLPGGGTTDEE